MTAVSHRTKCKLLCLHVEIWFAKGHALEDRASVCWFTDTLPALNVVPGTHGCLKNMYVDQLTDSTLSTHIYHLRLPGYPLLTNLTTWPCTYTQWLELSVALWFLCFLLWRLPSFISSPPHLPILQVPFLLWAFLSTPAPHDLFCLAATVFTAQLVLHPSTSLVLGFCSALVLQLYSLLSPCLLCWCHFSEDLSLALCSFSQFPLSSAKAISQLPLFLLPSRCWDLDLQNSVIFPLLLSQISNYQSNIPIGLCCHPLYPYMKLWLPRWYHHPSPQPHRLENAESELWIGDKGEREIKYQDCQFLRHLSISPPPSFFVHTATRVIFYKCEPDSPPFPHIHLKPCNDLSSPLE